MDFPRVSRDIYGDIMIQFMTAKELIEYCRLNKEFEGICKDPYTWKYLLYRDFGIISTSDDPKSEYMDEYYYTESRWIERLKNELRSIQKMNDLERFAMRELGEHRRGFSIISGTGQVKRERIYNFIISKLKKIPGRAKYKMNLEQSLALLRSME